MNSSDSALAPFDTAAGGRPLLPRQCHRHDGQHLFFHFTARPMNSSNSALPSFSAPLPFAAQGRHSHSGQRILRQWNPTVVNTVQEQG